ncbi:MAG TPA: Stk1 family PASTA domain-containing Ser/Thr kinase [Clostridiales bacterium]|nr:Stk1 family PASTA domain-containing Ser/Thr kinase [Clostridiales bacterium]
MLKSGMIISDRYEIVDKVGSGGMADVYKAKDQRLSRFVAIKVLKPEYSSDRSFVNKFRGEAQSAAGLSHPNIVNVYDVGEDSGLYYIVMELVEGITLKRFIEKKGKLEVKEAVGITIQIAQGMEAAHNNNIIHRDIKPQNIIISREGKVKVTDFGIAKASNSNTITSNAMGSVHYLSPEQARGGYSDEKSDIYSLGVSLYEMLSGKVPFAGDNTVSVALLHIQGDAVPLREIEPDIPVSLEKIVQKCMQKRSERRYHSASELIADLKKAIAYPDGEFVQIPAYVSSDSPTINISEDLARIKNGAYMDDEINDPMSGYPANGNEDDEEDLDNVDTKMDKFVVAGSIITIVILALAITFIVLMFVFPKGDKKPGGNDTDITLTPEPTDEPTPTLDPTAETFRVPRVLGLTQEDAETLIKTKYADAIIRYEEDYSEEYAVGYVSEQYPTEDTEYPVTSEVKITISIGKESVEIPDVYGLSEALAIEKLTDENFAFVVEKELLADDVIAEGSVIRTKPERETKYDKGKTVIIVVSTGPENAQVAVPNLIGSSENTAKTLLTDLGLVLGNVRTEASDAYPEGQITYQSTTAGQLVNPATVIDIIVSSGSNVEPTNPPVVRYIGEVYIDTNPFEYVGDGEAEIVLEMEQDGWATTIMDEMKSVGEFPFTLNGIEGESDSPGLVIMYVDGVPFTIPGEAGPKTWIVHFEAVEE